MCCKPVTTKGKHAALSGKDLREHARDTEGTDCPPSKGEANLAQKPRLDNRPRRDGRLVRAG